MNEKTALILSGGGARGAYQVGVLKGLNEILPEKQKTPFQILSGVSAGAINCAQLASEIHQFSVAIEKLVYLWSQIKAEQVFKTDFLSLNKFSLGLFGNQKLNALLDTAPLKELLLKNCDFSKIKKNLEDQIIESVIITANNYDRSSAISFIQARGKSPIWKESRRQAQPTELNVDHIMASSAIPMLFPPIQIQSQFFGDGCVRNNTPCSPAIRMGASKLFVIGVRTQLVSEKEHHLRSQKTENTHPQSNKVASHSPSMIKILNTLLNAVLLDSVEQDVLRIQRINQMARLVREAQSNKNITENILDQGLKEIPALCISPSQDIGEMARQHAHHLPRLIRMTISAIGSLDEASEILSYLLFDPNFCRSLIDMGYQDALTSRQQILEFFEPETP